MPAASRNRARDFEALTESAAQDTDFDPEVDADSTSENSGSDESADEDDGAGRAHYTDVTKSKLRKSKDVSLGPRYKGSRISRDEIMNDDESDDPFGEVLDDSDVDDSQSDSDMHGEGQESVVDGEEGSQDELTDDTDGTEDTELSEPEEDDGMDDIRPAAIDRSDVRKAMASERSTIAATISAANKADAEKGRAVKQQRSTFDNLLNMRIKLQKSLIASNSLVSLQQFELDSLKQEGQAAIDRAETAVFELWSTLTQLRDDFVQSRTGEKRKSHELSTYAKIEKLWSVIDSQEQAALPYRDATLTKWSHKSRGPSATPSAGKLNNARPATIVDVLHEQLSNTDRSLKRARTPRSCAPIQLANRVTEDPHIYDDADFYGLLLKELLEAKSATATTTAVNVDLSNLTKLRSDAKTRRNVDTKASKGRKLKYTVHEKLQNFCAPDDRTTWAERQTDDLFSSLFGQKSALNEDQVDVRDESDHEEDISRLMFSRARVVP